MLSFKRNVSHWHVFLVLVTLLACKKEVNNEGDNPLPVPVPAAMLKTADSVLTLAELPSGTIEAERLAQNNPASDFTPTGFYLPPGATMVILASQEAGSSLPVVLVGTYSRYSSKWNPTAYNLVPGNNNITDASGGIVYLRYVSNSPSGARAVIRFVKGMLPIPYFQLGKTTNTDWVRMVDSLKNVPDVQLVGHRAVITFSRTNALAYKLENQEALIMKADRIIALEDSISGLFGNDPIDQTNRHKYLMTESDKPDYYMAATWYRTWYRQPDAVTAILKAENMTWGPWHELGHMHQQGSWTWSALTEVTVNVYSIAVEKGLGAPTTRLTSQGEWTNAANYLALPVAERNFNGSNASVWVRLCMFQQLKLAFGENFYHELHRLARREPLATRPTTDDARMAWFMVKASAISGRNLSGFFRKWGMNLSTPALTDLAHDEIDKLGLPDPASDLTHLRD